MTEYNEGDLVEAVKGETVIRGLLVNICGLGRSLCLKLTLGIETDLIHLEANGFTITTIEKAEPVVVLPTELGVYEDHEGDLWQLNVNGWKLLTSDPPDAFKPENYAPFALLAPVSETAKKVLDRMNGWWAHDEHRGLPIFLSALREEFGATK